MKKLLSAALALCMTLCLCAPAFAAQNSMDNFRRTAAYNNNFADVSASHWAAPSVKTCYEYGLMTGSGGGKFTPGGTLTVAQALAIADRIHEIYATGKSTLKNGGGVWYQPYVDYALENGIIEPEEFSAYDRPVTRGEAARIFAAALPPAEVHAINDIDHLTDVPRGTTTTPCCCSITPACSRAAAQTAASGRRRPSPAPRSRPSPAAWLCPPSGRPSSYWTATTWAM